MTATLADLDLSLSWVTYSADSDSGCTWLQRTCGWEPVARAVWKVTCEHIDPANLLCARHRDDVLEADKRPDEWYCEACEAPFRLVRMEPVR